MVKDKKEPELGDGSGNVDSYYFDDHTFNHDDIPAEFVFEKSVDEFDFKEMFKRKGLVYSARSIRGMQYGNDKSIHDNGIEYFDLFLLLRDEEEWMKFTANDMFFRYRNKKYFLAEINDYIYNEGFKTDIALDEFIFSNDIVDELKRTSDKGSDIQNIVLGENELLYFWS